jgi:hypothetical protein
MTESESGTSSMNEEADSHHGLTATKFHARPGGAERRASWTRASPDSHGIDVAAWTDTYQ